METGDFDSQSARIGGSTDAGSRSVDPWQNHRMKVLVAGATGAIGRPLLHDLGGAGHEVFALVRSPKPAGTLPISTHQVVADALDAAGVLATVHHIRPDAIINELTSLPKHYTPEEMKAAAARD